jgi:hypothetical protein
LAGTGAGFYFYDRISLFLGNSLHCPNLIIEAKLAGCNRNFSTAADELVETACSARHSMFYYPS